MYVLKDIPCEFQEPVLVDSEAVLLPSRLVLWQPEDKCYSQHSCKRFETAKAKHDCSLPVQLDSVFPNLQVAKKFKSNKFMITGLISTTK